MDPLLPEDTISEILVSLPLMSHISISLVSKKLRQYVSMIADERYTESINKDRDILIRGDVLNYKKYGVKNHIANLELAYIGGSNSIISAIRDRYYEDWRHRYAKKQHLLRGIDIDNNDDELLKQEMIFIVRAGNLIQFRYMMSKRPMLVLSTIRDNVNIAHDMAVSGNIEFVQELLVHGIHCLYNVLYGAYKGGHKEMIDWLWVVIGKRNYYMICLLGACAGGQLALYEELIDSLNSLEINLNIKRLLCLACSSGNTILIAKILERCQLDNITEDYEPLYEVCRSGSLEAYKMIREYYPAKMRPTHFLYCLEYVIEAYGKLDRPALAYHLIGIDKKANDSIINICHRYGLDDILDICSI